MGYSNNPGGRRKYDKGAKERMGEVTPEVVEFWIRTMRDESEQMSHRLRCSENIAWGFLGKPSQQVFAAHAHVDFNDVPKDAPEVEKLAAMYGAMLGAVMDEPPPMLDVTPSRMSALTRSRSPSFADAELDAIEADEPEFIEPKPRQRVVRRAEQAEQQPPRRERIVRRPR
jgi:hypothetical protein